jgi:serine/threonine protein kinase
LLLAQLGAGGMGEVWKARDTRLNRIVAVKRLASKHTARFEQEARAVAALNHPNICQIFDIGRLILKLGQNAYGWSFLGRLRMSRGETSEARRCFEEAYSLAPKSATVVGPIAGLLVRAGEKRRAEELLGNLGPAEQYGVPVAWALFHLYQGETEKAVDWWDKVIDQRSPVAVLWPRVEDGALRASPRWPALAKRMNLPKTAW